MTYRHCARTILLLSISLCRGAWSQSAPGPSATPDSSASQRETARAWGKEGRRLVEQKDYAGALERYTAAYRLVRAPTVGIEVARTLEALGKLVEANAMAVEVMNLPASGDEPEVFSAARGRARELLVRLTPLVPALRVDVTPPDALARVVIDGEDMASLGGQRSFKLNPGKHELVVSAPGYRAATRSVALRQQDHQTVSIALAAATPPPVTSTPLTQTGDEPVSGNSNAKLEDAPRVAASTPTLGYVAVGTAGVAAVLGSVTGTLAFTTKPDCPRNRCQPDQRDEANASARYGNVSTVCFGVALVAGAWGLWELLGNAPTTAARRDPPGEARLVPLRAGALLEYSGQLF